MKNELWVYANGTSVEGLIGQYNGNGAFDIQSTNDSLVSKHSTYLRGCSS